VTKSRLLKKLRGGDFVRVALQNRVMDPWMTQAAGKFGFDVIWLDMEHRPYTYEVIPPIAVACRATGMDLMVRIRKNGYTSAMGPLEFGANGLMVPHCRSVEEARQWSEWARFPPLGKRGFDNAWEDADYGFANSVDYMKEANEETFLVLQVEDKEAVECIDEIIAVEGVDMIFIGPADLTISYGLPMQRKHPTIQRAFDKVANAVAKAGKWWGTITATPESAQEEMNRGARMITCADDHFLLVQGLKDSASRYEKVKIK
jgi:4-hydroxy-2-oxoheptanedioate aldolase